MNINKRLTASERKLLGMQMAVGSAAVSVADRKRRIISTRNSQGQFAKKDEKRLSLEEFQCLLDYKSLSATFTKYCIFHPYGTVGVVRLLSTLWSFFKVGCASTRNPVRLRVHLASSQHLTSMQDVWQQKILSSLHLIPWQGRYNSHHMSKKSISFY